MKELASCGEKGGCGRDIEDLGWECPAKVGRVILVFIIITLVFIITLIIILITIILIIMVDTFKTSIGNVWLLKVGSIILLITSNDHHLVGQRLGRELL